MTLRQALEYALVEINKVGAPSLLREDFIYLINKAITYYVNKRYNIYEVTQQLTDDLRVLTKKEVITTLALSEDSVFTATYTGVLPQDYLHILNCSVEFKYAPTFNSNCPIKATDKFKGVKRMTSEMYSGLIDNYYLRPSPKTPFYYLRNSEEILIETDGKRIPKDRDGNASPVNIEVIYGNNINKFAIKRVLVDYLRVPRYMYITEEEIEAEIDTSQVMEFPYYACLEIIKELVALLLENASDPRLQTNIPINESISSQGAMGGQRRSR